MGLMIITDQKYIDKLNTRMDIKDQKKNWIQLTLELA